MTEAEVALRLAEYLLRLPGADRIVDVRIDGAGVKVKGNVIFEIAPFLQQQGWHQVSREGKNRWTGEYTRGGTTLRLEAKSGEGDVVISVAGRRIIAECKQGPLVKRQGSQERKHLAAALGQAILWRAQEKDIVIAAVPDTERFRKIADAWRERPLIRKAGIQICLVATNGGVSGLAL